MESLLRFSLRPISTVRTPAPHIVRSVAISLSLHGRSIFWRTLLFPLWEEDQQPGFPGLLAKPAWQTAVLD
jgi:hypothetical protein